MKQYPPKCHKIPMELVATNIAFQIWKCDVCQQERIEEFE